MKIRALNTISILTLAVAASATAARLNIESVQPPHWWTGMADNTLQLQIYGKDIKSSTVKVDYPGVTLDSVVRLDGSDNWQYLYFTISPEAKPGKMTITWTDGKKSAKYNYELLERKAQKGAQGFTAADVLYMVMPDRFADGNTDNNQVKTMHYPVGANRDNLNVRHGGDLNGISDHIAYLDSLGITAVWLNPVLENDMPDGSYHGYATTDYYKVDPRFGSNDDYKALIDTLHSKGIKTVMDMIFNHSGSAHPWFVDRPSSDWFNFPDGYVQTNYRLSTITDPYASDYDKKLSVDGWFVESMPDLNQRNPHLMKYLIQNSIWWIEEAQIDGIRMDTYPYADKERMGEWIDAVLTEYPNFNIVGECWFSEPAGEAYWQRNSKLAAPDDTKLPTVMDFALMMKMRDMAPLREKTDPWNGLNKIYDHLALDYIYPEPLKVLRFLDNHDTERFILAEPEDLSQWKQALTLILTLPGIPQLYYGTELLMSGDRKPGDGNVRRDMPGGFPGDTVNAFVAEGRTPLQNEAYDFISRILKWRKNSQAMAVGDMKHFMPTNGVYLYRRSAGEDEVIVMMNGTDESLSADMSRYAEVIAPNSRYIDILTEETIIPLNSDGIYEFSPREVRILVPVP